MTNPTDMPSNLDDERTLRLVWPQWQGAGTGVVAQLLPEFPLHQARRGYAVGARVLQAVLPDHGGPTEIVPVESADPPSEAVGGIEARGALTASLAAAQQAIARHDVDRILTLGGECSVSVAPFAALADRYGEDLAIVWIDSHPDVGTPQSGYDGYHAMALAALTGHGDEEIIGSLPATIDTHRVAIAGLHDWTEDDFPNIAEWGITSFPPDQLRDSSAQLLQWLESTGATKVAIHFDVDVIDSDEHALGLGQVPGGLTGEQARRVVQDLAAASDIVGLTVAEFIPRDVLTLAGLLDGLPLIGD
ncbi:MAG TPA: arginase family protein [Baekduia sp.]|nr:arginase family protein [Baekduia sp.]